MDDNKQVQDKDKKNGNNTPPEQRPQKSEVLILQQTEEAALSQLDRNLTGLFLSGLSAGLDLGFSVLLMAALLQSFGGVYRESAVHFITSMAYPLGFIFVVLGRSELFTEHTTLAVLPILQGISTIKKLLRLWVIVYASNIIGGLIFALVLSYFGSSLHYLHPDALAKIATNMIGYSWLTKLLTAALAGWLMGLLAWLVAAARDTISQIVIIFIITLTIGLVGLPHCIAGNIEVAMGMFMGQLSVNQYINFLVPVTLGNTLGGMLFVAVIKFNHTMNSGEEKDVDIRNAA